jgi:hypothetical protein
VRFELETAFIGHLKPPAASNNNNSWTYTFYKLVWYALHFSACCVFPSPLVIASSSGRSPSSGFLNFLLTWDTVIFNYLTHQALLCQEDSFWTESLLASEKDCLFLTHSYPTKPLRMDNTENIAPSRCVTWTMQHTLLLCCIRRPLPGKGCCSQSHYLVIASYIVFCLTAIPYIYVFVCVCVCVSQYLQYMVHKQVYQILEKTSNFIFLMYW